MNIFESLRRTVSIGPLNLPLIIIPLVSAWVVYHFIIKLFYRSRPDVLKEIDRILFNGLFIIIIAWKLSPVVFQFSTVISNPSALFYLPGGNAGIATGITAALIYFTVQVLRHKGSRRGFLKGLCFNLSIIAVLIVMFAGAAAVIAQQMNKSSADYNDLTGRKAPEFKLEGSDGLVYRLADYAGNTVVINFWASWCPPCRAELPELEKFYNEEVGDETVFLSVNMYASEQEPEKLDEFIAEQGLSFPVLLDRTGRVTDDYAVESIPTTFIIDGEGIISAVLRGAVTGAGLIARISRL